MTGSSVVRLDRGYVRVVHGEVTSGGHPLSIHLSGKGDTSPAYRGPYAGKCGWCWLNANHSEQAHATEVTQ